MELSQRARSAASASTYCGIGHLGRAVKFTVGATNVVLVLVLLALPP